MKILFIWPNKDIFGFKPIGLSILSGIAKSLGWETRLFDTTEIDLGFIDNRESGQQAKFFKPVDLSAYDMTKKKVDLREAFLKVLQEFQPDALGFSARSDEGIIAGELSKIAKTAFPSLPIIWGGKSPTIDPEQVLTEFHADFACVAEGLGAFREWLIHFGDSLKWRNIPNIWWKDEEGVHKNPIAPLISDLDGLPYADWDIFDKRHFIKLFDGKAYVGGDHMLNWGCPYHCTYCINHFFHDLYDNNYFMRRYSIPRIIKELKYLKEKHDLEFLRFHDEDFLMRPLENLRELSEEYSKEIGLPFVIETNPKSVTREKVALLKQMNCVSASVAIESGDPQVRKNLLTRVDTEEDVTRAFPLFHEFGIRTSSFNLLAIPYESRDKYMRTVELNRSAKVQYPSIGFFFPFEGTELRRISIEGGFFDPNDHERTYRHDRPALKFTDLSEQELIEMRNVFVLYVKLPKSLWPFIRRSEQLDQCGNTLRLELLDFYDHTVWSNDGFYRGEENPQELRQRLEALYPAGSQ